MNQITTTWVDENALRPSNVELEETLLGSILLDPNALFRVMNIICPETFYSTPNRIIYEAALALNAKGSPPDLLLICSHLNDNGLLQPAGGMARLAQMISVTVSSVNVDRYAEVLQEKYMRRKLIELGSIAKGLGLDTRLELPSVLAEIEKSLFSLAKLDNHVGLIDNAVVAQEAYESLSNQASIYPTGLSALDEHLIGFQDKTLTILAGRPSMGKSATALFLALQAIILHNKPVVYFSMEMSREQLEFRLWSIISIHPHFASYQLKPLRIDRIRKHFSGKQPLTIEECENLAKILDAATTLNLKIDDRTEIAPHEIVSECRKLKSEEGSLGLVVIDYLQKFTANVEGDNGAIANAANKAVNYLFNKSKELVCPILLLGQLNRGCESRNDKKPMMSDMATSGGIEQYADNIILCYRDRYYNKQSHNHDLELIIAKQRQGQTGTARIGYHLETQLMYDLPVTTTYDMD